MLLCKKMLWWRGFSVQASLCKASVWKLLCVKLLCKGVCVSSVKASDVQKPLCVKVALLLCKSFFFLRRVCVCAKGPMCKRLASAPLKFPCVKASLWKIVCVWRCSVWTLHVNCVKGSIHCSKIVLKVFKYVQGGSVHCTSSHQTFTRTGLRMTQVDQSWGLFDHQFFQCNWEDHFLESQANVFTAPKNEILQWPKTGAALTEGTTVSHCHMSSCLGQASVSLGAPRMPTNLLHHSP